MVDEELNHTAKGIVDNENPTERDKLEDKLDGIKDERPFEKNDEAPREVNKSVEVVVQKEDMILYMKRNGTYERTPDQIERIPFSILRKWGKAEDLSMPLCFPMPSSMNHSLDY